MINHEIRVCGSADAADSPLRIRQSGNQLLSVVPLPSRRRARREVPTLTSQTRGPALMSHTLADDDASRATDTTYTCGLGKVDLAQSVE